MATATTDYQVRLDAFEGPLDLLLHLIRRAEVDITEISIARIADQYIAHLQNLEDVDIDTAAEFLVVAATLMEIKSRVLTPPVDADEDGDEATPEAADAEAPFDPRSDLISQLLAYKKHRDAADALDRRRERWEARFPGGGAGFDREAVSDVIAEKAAEFDEDLEIYDLVEAFAQILAQVDMSRIGAHHVAMETDDTPIEVHEQDILKRLLSATDSGHALPLKSLFEGHSRVQMIGLFLATLELVRQQRVRVEQPSRDESLVLRLRPEDERDPAEEASDVKPDAPEPESAIGS